jgi:hypothetical protein
MSREAVLLFALVLCMSFIIVEAKAHDSSYEIVAVYGLTPSIDGTIDDSEWSDASSVSFNKTEVFVKQDGVNLYVGFNNSESSFHDEDFVGILIDVNDDGSTTLQSDDIGMVVYRNGTFYEANVTGGTWTLTDVSGWTAAVFSTPNMWQVEFNITYSKVIVVAGEEKDIGVVLACNRRWEQPYPFCWPQKYFPDIYDDPSEWGAITSNEYYWISEFSSYIILPLFMVLTMLAVVFAKRKPPRKTKP